jgi:hypothetical protein
VCNRTRNEHFAYQEQAAKLNFTAVALTTAVKVSNFNIYLLSQLQHIYLYICGVILQNLHWVQLKFDLCQFLCQERPLLVQNFHPV